VAKARAERRQAPAVHESALILDLAGEAIVTIDEQDVVRSWNRAAERLFGYSAGEIVGQPLALLVPPERLAAGELEMLRSEVRQHGVMYSFETERLTKGGRAVRVNITRSELVDGVGRSIGQCSVIRDVSLPRAVVHQLYESEKLAALRAMAAGFAREVANPLAGVLGLLQLIERRTREPETRSRLIEARNELLRAGQIIRELSDFTRADGALGIIDVNEVLRAALTFAKYANEAAPVTVRLDADLQIRPLVGARNHLLQACLHLVMNAYDAMREQGGSLTVHSRQDGEEIVLAFEDSGRGITPAVRSRIFEPFFTTKPEGSGTGLGLFVCHRIVTKAFGGCIEVETELGVGSRFTVRLPLRPAGRTEPRPG
jgi:two-component system NtrC family sensor kinase